MIRAHLCFPVLMATATLACSILYPIGNPTADGDPNSPRPSETLAFPPLSSDIVGRISVPGTILGLQWFSDDTHLVAVATPQGPLNGNLIVRVFDTTTFREGGYLELPSWNGSFDVSPTEHLMAMESCGRVAFIDLPAFNVSSLMEVDSEQPECLGSTAIGSSVGPIEYSPDGGLVAIALGEDIGLWDPGTQTLTRTFHRYGVGNQSVAFSPDGQYLAAGGDGTGNIVVWDLPSGSQLFVATRDPYQYWDVWDIDFSPRGDQLAAAMEEGNIKLVEIPEGYSNSFAGTRSGRNEVAYSPDGEYIAFGIEGNLVRILNVRNWGDSRTLAGHSGQVQLVSFAHDGTKLATGASLGNQSGEVLIWKVND